MVLQSNSKVSPLKLIFFPSNALPTKLLLYVLKTSNGIDPDIIGSCSPIFSLIDQSSLNFLKSFSSFSVI